MEAFWKSRLEDAAQLASTAKKAQVQVLGKSAGGRAVYLFFYGKKNTFARTANYSSALGARDESFYADKRAEHYRPTLFLVGGIHGAEFEGSVAILNLIHILETGVDFAGEAHTSLQAAAEAVNLMLVPFCNPDGRARVIPESFVGKGLADLRYFDQGTWKKDGALCGWPACKSAHPMKMADFLGGYFNDDGINLMHDNPFMPMAEETGILYRLVDEYVPDFTVLLHGGDNCRDNYFLKPAYAPGKIKDKVQRFEEEFEKECAAAGMHFAARDMDCGENNSTPVAFNLASALTHLCGEPCVTYESNQGLVGMEVAPFTEKEIYTQHLFLFEKLCCYLKR